MNFIGFYSPGRLVQLKNHCFSRFVDSGICVGLDVFCMPHVHFCGIVRFAGDQRKKATGIGTAKAGSY